MEDYWVSFRISDKTIGGETYSERREALIGAVLDESKGYWDETTSFLLVRTSRTIDQLASAAKAAIALSEDLVVMRKLSVKTARYVGALSDKDIFHFMEYLERA